MMRYMIGILPRLPTPVSAILLYGWMARPHFVAGSAVVYLAGAMVARYETHAFNVTAFALGLVVMWLIQISTHFFNEYYDQPTDALNTHRTLFSGGSGALQVGALAPRVAPWAGVAALLLAIVLVLILSSLPAFGPTTLLIFGWALVGAVGYSVPPLALANRGWGELDTSLVAGLLTPLFAYNLQTGGISVTLLRAGLALAVLVFANMIGVAFPDYEADRAVGKRTLVVQLGPARAARLFGGALIVGYAAAGLAIPWNGPGVAALAAALLPLALCLYVLARGGYRRSELFSLNTMLGITAFGVVSTAVAVAFFFAA